MADTAPEPVKSTQQLDLEARQAEDYVSPFVLGKTVGPNESLVSEDGFVGVDPIYQNAANETDEPLAAEDGVEKVIEDRVLELIETDAATAEANQQTTEAAKADEQSTATAQAPASSTSTSSASSPQPITGEPK